MPDTEPLSSEQIAKYEQDVSGDCPYFLQDIRPLLDHIRSLTSALEAEKKRREGAPHGKSCAVAEWELRMWAYGRSVRGWKHPGEKPSCNCWKAEETK